MTLSLPVCPKCGAPMVLRFTQRGARAGESFWGCPNYPQCTGTRPVS
ncbi:MAG: topoisomerase DNA-binding C4 zinc finger domain-containing protein [Opitutaceae bacterium]